MLLALAFETWQPEDMDVATRRPRIGALRDMSLRRRLVLVLWASGGLVALLGVIVGLQYIASYNGALRVQEQLTPAAELADNLLLAQSAASGDLSDYVLTDRARALTAHEMSVDMADSLIRALEVTLEGDPPLLGQLAGLRAAQQVWINEDATPTLALMAEGRAGAAARATNLPKAWESFDSMIAATVDLRDSIEDKRSQARATTNSFARQLGFWLIVLAIALVTLAIAVSFAVNGWVIAPLLRLRREFTRAIQPPHTHPILPTGPPELQAAAHDAEELRRSLVVEIDEAKAARDGLEQDAPLVAAMRETISAPDHGEISGLRVAGTSLSVEGVLAGDWWDVIEVDDHTIGLVIADTSGHGPRATITALRFHDLLRASLKSGASPESVVRSSLHAIGSDDHFVTAVVGLIDVSTHEFTYVNAGHQPPVLITEQKDAVLCSRTGPLISSLGGQWRQSTVPFEPGSVLLAYTDGLVEGTAPEGGDVDTESMSRLIRAMDGPQRQDANEVLARVVSHIRESATDWNDDVTAVVVSCPVMAL